MKPWIRRRGYALSVRRWVWPSWRPASMPAGWTRIMAWEGRYHNFDVGVRGMVDRGCSEWGGASLLEPLV
jgi:hypothetical protein